MSSEQAAFCHERLAMSDERMIIHIQMDENHSFKTSIVQKTLPKFQYSIPILRDIASKFPLCKKTLPKFQYSIPIIRKIG